LGVIRVGPAGWAYKDWKGIVYPSKKPKGFDPAGNYYRTFFYFLNASNFNGKDVVSQAGITGFEGISSLQPAAPLINLSGYAALAGSTDNRPKANRIRTYQYRSSVTWSRGNHDMKFGAQLSHQAHAFLNGNASQGTFNWRRS
jgi:hypothetical protein